MFSLISRFLKFLCSFLVFLLTILYYYPKARDGWKALVAELEVQGSGFMGVDWEKARVLLIEIVDVCLKELQSS